MTRRSLTLVLPLCAALAVACSSDSSLVPEATAPKRVLTRLEVTPGRSFLVPGGTEYLTVSPRDQDGARIPEEVGGRWTDKATYVSSAPAIARVSTSGMVTAVAPGNAMISVSLTIGNETVLSAALIEVEPPEATFVVLTANRDGTWTPRDISMKSGGTVTWVVPDGVQPGTIWLNVWDTNAEKLEFTNGVARRTFSTPRSYFYGTGGGLMWYEEGGVVRVF